MEDRLRGIRWILRWALFLSLFLLIHESGHFLAALALGIHAQKFVLGIGREVCSYQIGETLFSLKLIPIAGYNEFSDAAFAGLAWYKLVFIFVSGALVSFLVAALGLCFNGKTGKEISEMFGYYAKDWLRLQYCFLFWPLLFIHLAGSVFWSFPKFKKLKRPPSFFNSGSSPGLNQFWDFVVNCNFLNLLAFPILDGGKIILIIFRVLGLSAWYSHFFLFWFLSGLLCRLFLFVLLEDGEGEHDS